MSDTLRRLFDQVADTLIDGITPQVVKDGEDERTILPSPAMVSAAITFLKNNNITAAVDNERLAAVRDKLAERQRRRPIKRVLSEAEDDLAARLGDPGTMQ